MNITCEQCATQHELEPPAWVVASGRAFRFRCSTCGHSQMASPKPPAPAPVEAPASVAATVSTPEPTRSEAPPAEGSSSSGAVYLKQDGKVYLVRDWATVQRWIMERRVDRTDLMSEGGVRWEPIGTRAELGSFFMAVERLEAVEQAQAGPSDAARASEAPFPFAQSDGQTLRRFGLLDDDTDGVTLGLPPLPTEEVMLLGAPPVHSDDPASPSVRRLTLKVPTPPPAPERRFGDPVLDGTVGNPVDDYMLPPMMRTPTPAPVEMRRMATIPPPALPATPEPALDRGASDPTQSDETLDPDADGPVDHLPQIDPHHEWTDEQPAPRRASWLPMALVAGLLLLVIGGLVTVWYTQRPPQPTATPPAEAGLGEALGTPPAPAKAPDPRPPVAPPPGDTDTDASGQDTDAPAPADPSAPAAPSTTPPATTPPPGEAKSPPKPVEPAKAPVKPVEPAKAPAKPPVAPKPPASTAKSLIDKGWAAVEKGDLSGGAESFEKALGLKPGDAAASFGLGYVLLKQGNEAAAAPHLCRASQSGGSDAREAAGMLAANALTCP